MEKESSRRELWPFIPIPIPLPIPISEGFFDEWLARVWPRGYEDSLIHIQNARIEVLRAVEAAVKRRIEVLEKAQQEVKPKKEKVQVE